MSQPLLLLSNSGGTGTGQGGTTYVGPGVTKGVYRTTFVWKKDSTHTAQTLVPMAVVTRACTVKAITGAWLEVNAANTTLATFQVLKRSLGAAAAGTALLSTVGTLSNNATAQNWQVVSTAFALTQNAGAAAVAPILSTTAATVALAAGDVLTVTTVATSTQGTDMVISIDCEYTLNDEVASTNLI